MRKPDTFAAVDYDPEVASQVYTDITKEIYKAGKIPDIAILRRMIQGVLKKPVTNFSHFIARLDALIRDFGFPDAAELAIKELAGGAEARGVDAIPLEGPVIITSNHPGTYDGFVLISQLLRNDFKMMVSGIPFFMNLPNASKHLIYSTHDISGRMEAIRRSVRHLKNGGVLVIFPSGRIDPGPAVLPGAEEALSNWSRSIELFMRKVSGAELVLTIVSGVLSDEFIRHPYPRLFKNNHERRRVMEFMQVIKQMAQGKPVHINPKISFSRFLHSKSHENGNGDNLRRLINQQAQALLSSHISNFGL